MQSLRITPACVYCVVWLAVTSDAKSAGSAGCRINVSWRMTSVTSSVSAAECFFFSFARLTFEKYVPSVTSSFVYNAKLLQARVTQVGFSVVQFGLKLTKKLTRPKTPIINQSINLWCSDVFRRLLILCLTVSPQRRLNGASQWRM